MDAPGYRSDIDGLRGIAVCAVVLFHCQLGVQGGYTGVDVFFVISGFLITRLITTAQRKEEFSLKEFWLRRIRRLAPAVIVMVLATMAAGAWLMFPRDHYYFSKSSLAQVLLANNVHFYNYLDYFAGPAELQPLLHTWSLAVEEQFYLVFPLLMVFTRRWSAKRTAWLLGILGILSLAYSAAIVRQWPSAAFFLLPSRAWELLLGGILVFLPNLELKHLGWMGRACWESVSLIGLAGIITPFWLYDSNTLFPGAAALLPCCATALIIYANAQRSTWVSRVLSMPWLVGTGLISYSLYLWHWPILSYLHYLYGEALNPAVTASALLASVACGYLSWRFVETPFRRRQVIAADAILLRGVVGCSLLIVAGSVASLATRGFPGRWGEQVATAMLSSGNNMQQFRTGKAAIANQDKLPQIGVKRDSPRLLVWGDSHAAAIGRICDELAREHNIVGHIASRGGTVPLLGAYRIKSRDKVVPWNDSVVKFVSRNKIRHVILVSRWAANIRIRDNGLNDSLIADAHVRQLSPETSKAAFQRCLRQTVDALNDAGARVWIMRQVPHQEQDPFRLVINAPKTDAQVTGVTLAEHHARERDVDEVFSTLQGVTFLDPVEHCFDEQGRSYVGTPKVCYYSDPSHLSTEGARQLVKPLLAPVFQEAARETAQSVMATRETIVR